MATRFVLYADRLDQVDARPLLIHLAEDVANDMRRIVPVDTGATLKGIEVGAPSSDSIAIISRRDVAGDDPKVPIYLERGTRYMRAQPYMRPALYRYRAP